MIDKFLIWLWRESDIREYLILKHTKWISFLILFAILSVIPLTALGTAKVEISDGSVKALYHLEDTTDSSGNGFTLTNNGTTPFNASSSLLLNSADFGSPNTTRYLNSAASSTTSLSVSTWFRLQGATNVGPAIWGMRENVNNIEYLLGYSQTTHNLVMSRCLNLISCVSTTATSTLLNVWYHAVTTYNSGTGDLKLYLNNVLVDTKNETGTGAATTDNGLYLGDQDSRVTLTSMEGKMDETFLSNSVLSPTQISALYNNGVGAEVCTTVGCAGGGTAPSNMQVIWIQ